MSNLRDNFVHIRATTWLKGVAMIALNFYSDKVILTHVNPFQNKHNMNNNHRKALL